MPFVRVSRDKRGYELIALVHSSTRRGKPSKPRVLYVFRTPPGVKLGREPFDESVRRELEERNPDVQFDWEKLSDIPVPSPDVEYWRERRRAEKAAKQARREAEQDEPAGADAAEEADSAGAAESDDVFDGELDRDDSVEQGSEPLSGGSGQAAESLDTTDQDMPDEAAALPVLSGASAEPTATGEGHPAAKRRRRRRGGRRRQKREESEPGSPDLAIVEGPEAPLEAEAGRDSVPSKMLQDPSKEG